MSHSVLVSTDWVAEHLNDPNVRLVESNEDPLLYPSGHIPGAHEVDWTRDLNDQVVRDYLGQEGFQALMRRLGADENTLIVFYGDKSNWWACYAFWVFGLFGHTKAAVMDGGRLKWVNEGRELTKDKPSVEPSAYVAQPRNDEAARAFRDEVLAHTLAKGQMVDVRSPQEFSGERMHMPDYPNEGALRGGHIPGAKSVPWARATNPETGEFLPAEDLRRLYQEEQGLDPAAPTIAYCRIGERSSHTWFALKHLLGFQNVKNYDGSWTEWGNLVGVPVEKGA
jgi:thiosulfate/3-mercaptopyruvate sulfurtransferase